MPAFLATFVNSPLAAKKVVIFVETHVHREPVDFHRPGCRHHEVVGILEILHRSRCYGDGFTLSGANFGGRPLKKTENKMRQKERAFSVQNPAFSVEDSKVSVATCTATTQMASIFRICGTAGSSPAIFMSKEGTKPRQVESTDLSTG